MTVQCGPKRQTVDMIVENSILNALEINRAKTELGLKAEYKKTTNAYVPGG